MRGVLALLLLVVFAVLPVAGGQATEPSPPAVLATTLDNGLRVLLLEDHRSSRCGIASVRATSTGARRASPTTWST